MSKARMFKSWKIGLLHLVIVVIVPVIPIIIYLITEGAGKAYLYTLILAVTASLQYEYANHPYKNGSRILILEDFVCSVALVLILLGSLFLLFLSFAVENGQFSGHETDIRTWTIRLIFLFVVPVITTVIEIIRCIVADIQANEYQPEEENIARGAGNV